MPDDHVPQPVPAERWTTDADERTLSGVGRGLLLCLVLASAPCVLELALRTGALHPSFYAPPLMLLTVWLVRFSARAREQYGAAGGGAFGVLVVVTLSMLTAVILALLTSGVRALLDLF